MPDTIRHRVIQMDNISQAPAENLSYSWELTLMTTQYISDLVLGKRLIEKPEDGVSAKRCPYFVKIASNPHKAAEVDAIFRHTQLSRFVEIKDADDLLYVFEVRSGKIESSKAFDCKDASSVQALKQRLGKGGVDEATRRTEGASEAGQDGCQTGQDLSDTDSAFDIVVCPDLSPVLIEILGEALLLDPSIFARHIISDRRGVFRQNDRIDHFNAWYNLDPSTISLECDIDFSDFGPAVDLGRVKELASPNSSFLQLQWRAWPDFLHVPLQPYPVTRQVSARSRITIHNANFIGESPVSGHSPTSTERNIQRPTVLIFLSPIIHQKRKTASRFYSSDDWQERDHEQVRGRRFKADGDPFLFPTEENEDFTTHEIPQAIQNFVGGLSKTMLNSALSLEQVRRAESICLSNRFVSAYAKLSRLDLMRWDYLMKKPRKVVRSNPGEISQSMEEIDARFKRRKEAVHYLKNVFPSTLTMISSPNNIAEALLQNENVSKSLQDTSAAVMAMEPLFAKILNDVSNDIEETRTRLTTARGDARHVVQEELALTQLAEARRSIEQNTLVRKLTILAFCFIPITTVSSIFGMNLREYGSNGAPAWQFGITAGIVTAVTFILATYPTLERCYKAYHSLPETLAQHWADRGEYNRARVWLVASFKYIILARNYAYLPLTLPIKYLLSFAMVTQTKKPSDDEDEPINESSGDERADATDFLEVVLNSMNAYLPSAQGSIFKILKDSKTVVDATKVTKELAEAVGTPLPYHIGKRPKFYRLDRMLFQYPALLKDIGLEIPFNPWARRTKRRL